MARARNIKPGIFKNEVLGVADPLYTLLFEGLWLLGDRAGRLEDRPLRIKAEVFPYREGLDIGTMLGWLQANGFIRRYVVGGLALIQILAFEKHQNPHKNEPESTYPPPPEVVCTASEEIGSARADSGFLIPDSGCAALPPPPAPTPAQPKKSKPKTAIPPDFAVSDRVRSWAKEKGYLRIDEHLESFKTKAVAKDYRYASWDDAFMQAVREDWAKLRGRGVNGAPAAAEAMTTPTPRQPNDAARYLAEKRSPEEIAESARRGRLMLAAKGIGQPNKEAA